MAEELAQGGSTTLRNATGTGDYLTRIAGQTSSGGLFREQTNLLRGKGEAEAEVIRGQQKAKETQAAGEVELAGKMRDKATGLMEEYKATVKPYEEFIPSQNNISDMIGLFGIMSFIGASGGGEGKFAGVNALSNMGAAMQGYRMGKKDLFEKEMKEFEKNFNSTKAFNEQQREILRQGMESMAYDKELGMAQIRQAAARESGSVVDALIRKGQFEDAYKLAEARVKQLNDAEQKMIAMAQKQQTTSQQQMIAQRVVNAIGGVASSMEAMTQLPAGTNVGILGNLQTKDGMINFIRNAAGRKLSAPEAKAMETLFTGITRNLAAIEASGSAMGLAGLSTQLEKLQPKAGDTAYDVALKIADIRRIATENVQPMIDAGVLPKQQADTARALVGRVEKAIPFTTNEVVAALPGRKEGQPTIMGSTQTILGGGTTPAQQAAANLPTFATEAEAAAAEAAGTLRKGTRVKIGGKTGTWE